MDRPAREVTIMSKRIFGFILLIAAGLRLTGQSFVEPPRILSTFLDYFPQKARFGALFSDDVPASYIWQRTLAGLTAGQVTLSEDQLVTLELLGPSDNGRFSVWAYNETLGSGASTTLKVGAPTAKEEYPAYRTAPLFLVEAILPMPDGAVVLAGQSRVDDGPPHFGLVRHEANGKADPRWNSLTNGSEIRLEANPTFLALMRDDNGGVIVGSSLGRVLRVTPDGTWDRSFSLKQQLPGPVKRLERSPSGNYLAAGPFGLRGILRDGGRDPNFLLDGQVFDREILTVTPVANAKILITARRLLGDGAAGPVEIRRVQSNGALDRSFPIHHIEGAGHGTRSAALLSDGSVLIGGKFSAVSGVAARNLIQVHPDGSLNASMGKNLPDELFQQKVREVTHVAALPDGGAIVAASSLVAYSTRLVLYRFDESGHRIPLEVPMANLSSVYAMATDRSGRVKLAGDLPVKSLVLPASLKADVRPRIDTAAKSWLRSAVFRNPDDGYAVGLGGRVFRTRDAGQSWTRVATGLTNDLFAVALRGPAIYAAGSAGLVVRLVEGEPVWDRLDTGTDANLRSMLPSASLVVGDRGTILSLAGDSFRAIQSPTTNDLLAVAGHGNSTMACGRNGTLLLATANGWMAIGSNSTNDLHSVAPMNGWTAVDKMGAVIENGRELRSIVPRLGYRVLTAAPNGLWAGCADGVVMNNFGIERQLPTASDIVSIVPVGNHGYAFDGHGRMFVLRNAELNGLNDTSFALVSPANGQTVIKKNGTFSIQTTGSVVTSLWVARTNASGARTLVNSTPGAPLGLGEFGSFRFYIGSGAEGSSFRLIGPVDVTLDGPPEIFGLGSAFSPVTRSATAGSQVALSPTVVGPRNHSYQWFRGSTAIAGATNARLELASVRAGDSGIYRLLVRDGTNGATGYASLGIAATNGITTFLKQPRDQVLYAGETALADYRNYSRPETMTAVREDGTSLPTAIVFDRNQVAIQPTNMSDSGLFRLVSRTNTYPTARSEPRLLIVRGVTNRLVVLQPPSSADAGRVEFISIGLYGVGDETEVSGSFTLARPVFSFTSTAGGDNPQVGYTTSNRLVWFKTKLPASRSVTNGYVSLGTFRAFYSTLDTNTRPMQFTDRPRPLEVRAADGRRMPARFTVLPAFGFEPSPSDLMTTSFQPGSTQTIGVTNRGADIGRRIRVRVTGLGVDGLGQPIRLANATGEDVFGQFLDIGPVPAGAGTTTVLRYSVPDGLSSPDPILRFDWPESDLPEVPASAFLSMIPQPLPAGTRTLRFNTVIQWKYQVQSASNPGGVWTTNGPWIEGADRDMDHLIQFESTPTQSRFWRLRVERQGL